MATPFRGPAEASEGAPRTLVLNTGRVRDQWHTMTRTGDVVRLAQHTPEPFLDVNPDDAACLRLVDGGFARVESRHGAAIMRIRLSRDQRPGEVFAAMHWSDAYASTGPADRLVGAALDPVSGQPELKATAVMLTPQPMHWQGLLLRRVPWEAPAADYWCIAVAAGFAYTLAGTEPLGPDGGAPDADWVMPILGAPAGPDLVVYADPARGNFRFASFVDGALDACLFIARDCAFDPRSRNHGSGFRGEFARRKSYVCSGWRRPRRRREHGADDLRLLAVGRTTIVETITRYGIRTATEIGAALKAGTNCGSCLRPELEKILRGAAVQGAPAENGDVAGKLVWHTTGNNRIRRMRR